MSFAASLMLDVAREPPITNHARGETIPVAIVIMLPNTGKLALKPPQNCPTGPATLVANVASV